MSDWQKFERVAIQVLSTLRAHLGLETVEGKQCVEGRSGTKWEVDGLASVVNGDRYLLVEARLRMRASTQEEVGALAWRIVDTGAEGAFLVHPIEPQTGAKKVAMAANIKHFMLNVDATETEYIARFLGKAFIGACAMDEATVSDSAEAELRRHDGTIRISGSAGII